jgi:cytochrome c oxidase subunit 1
MLFALAFLPMSASGADRLAARPRDSDIQLHDTITSSAISTMSSRRTIFAMFADLYWYPKVTGKKLSDSLGRIHFWGSLLFINGIFMPMFIQGMAGVSRRLYDGGASYLHAQHVLGLNKMMSVSAWCLALFQMPLIITFFWSMFGRKARIIRGRRRRWNGPRPRRHRTAFRRFQRCIAVRTSTACQVQTRTRITIRSGSRSHCEETIEEKKQRRSTVHNHRDSVQWTAADTFL